MTFLAYAGCFLPLTASMTSEVKNNYAYVITQDICNKFIEVNFCVGCIWSISKLNILRLLIRFTFVCFDFIGSYGLQTFIFQVVTQINPSPEADWWSVGVILFEVSFFFKYFFILSGRFNLEYRMQFWNQNKGNFITIQ